jgi:ligand-binding sensor domain-containing protein
MRTASETVGKVERYAQPDGLSDESVWCLMEDREHNVWVGTQNGLNRFRDEKVTTLTRREGLKSDDVEALAAGPDGAIWASTSLGIQRIDGDHRESYLEGTRTFGMHVDPSNTVWAGTPRGVARMQDGAWRSLPAPADIHLADVTAITGDAEHGVWFSDGRTGPYRWMKGRTSDFSDEPLFEGRSIRVAQADGAGRVWFGFYEGGVVLFDGSGFHAYSESDGLAGGSVNAVHIDKATVWVASERGLSRLDGQRFVFLDRSNGLPGERVQWILPDRTDRLCLGFSMGVACLERPELDRAARDRSYQVAFQFLDTVGRRGDHRSAAHDEKSGRAAGADRTYDCRGRGRRPRAAGSVAAADARRRDRLHGSQPRGAAQRAVSLQARRL